MLVWQWFSSQGSVVRLLHRFLRTCPDVLGVSFSQVADPGFWGCAWCLHLKQFRDRHRWHITDARAGSVAQGCAFGRTQSCFVSCFQGHDISLRCQDGARDGPVIFCSYTLICAAPAKPGQLVTECKEKSDHLLLLRLILFQTPQSYAAAASLGPVAVC